MLTVATLLLSAQLADAPVDRPAAEQCALGLDVTISRGDYSGTKDTLSVRLVGKVESRFMTLSRENAATVPSNKKNKNSDRGALKRGRMTPYYLTPSEPCIADISDVDFILEDGNADGKLDE